MHSRLVTIIVSIATAALAGAAAAQCPPDAVAVGPLCVDRYEASTWKIMPENTALIAAVRAGVITSAAQISGTVVRKGAGVDDYGSSCTDTAAPCATLYAVSVPGVAPSANLTWFQAAGACRNSGKRLLTNAEWQMAAFGTPDPGVADNNTTTCNTTLNGASDPAPAGSRSLCVSDVAVHDMVGNLREWVADWIDFPADCDFWMGGDTMCFGGGGVDTHLPAALQRGGSFADLTYAGVFAADAGVPTVTAPGVGFRCAR
jgi:hypothetical protein